MTYMIERRYGRSNTDFLLALDADGTPLWTGCGKQALALDKQAARDMLALVREIAIDQGWNERGTFQFATIRDRSDKPRHVGSTYVNLDFDEDDSGYDYAPSGDRERFNCRQ